MSIARSLGSILERVGISIKRAASQTPARRAVFMEQENITLVVDVGAHVGDYGSGLRNRGYRGRIEAFEPNPDSFAQLQSRAGKDPLWNVWNVGLGDFRGERDLHISANQVSSSFLGMHDAHAQAAPDSRYIGSRSVEIRRLDDLSIARPLDRVLLKLDTQGYEQEVLNGGAETIQKVRLIEIEMSIVPLYEGQPLVRDALAFMEDLGFVLIWIDRVHFTDDRMRLLQLDGIFGRRDT